MTKTETVMSAKFKQAGVKAHVVAFDRAIALFQNNGGTFEEALERIRAAYGMQGEGLRSNARGLAPFAEALRPSPSEAGRVLREQRQTEPTQTQRRMTAELAKVTALTVLDTVKVRGRGPWGDIAVGELRAIVTEGTRDAAIAKLILREVPIGTSTLKKVRDVVSISTFQKAMQKAAEVVDVTVGEEASHAA